MSLSGQLASIGLHSLAVAADVIGCEAAGKLGLSVVRLLGDRVGDESRRLGDALGRANQRAWSALESALAGSSLRERLKGVAGRAEERVFATQLQTFLATVPLGDAHDSEESARRKALAELRHARKAGLIDPAIESSSVQSAAEPMARFTRREEMIDAQESSLREVALAMRQAGYVYLARVLVVRPDGGEPLLLVAMGYFFRRAVESDEALFRGLALTRMKQLQASVESGFAALELALDLHADRMEAILGDIHDTLAETHEGVLDLRSRMSTQGEQLRAIGEAVQQLLEQHRMHRREVRPGDSLTLRDEGERAVVRQLVRRYHALPDLDRAGSPALLNAIGKLEVIAGDFGDAQRDFSTVATLVEDRTLRAEAHFNAYRAALEKRDPISAMLSLTEALAGDARRFSPVPLETYEPERILGAGGFGVAILCRHRYMKARVVVKSLWLEPLGVAADHVFDEARLLRQIDHPGIIRIADCGYVDPAAKERPYLVMDYFEGETLEQHLRTHKTLSTDDYLVVARQIAEGLKAAHEQGILHRDVKPANLLVRGVGERRLVKLIDFGLAMRQRTLDDRTTTRAANTLLGQSIAGTLTYAAPEQLRGEPVGPTADIYAFARTSCQLLFGTTHPLPRHWQAIPTGLAALLGQCLEEEVSDRPDDFAAVLTLLEATTPKTAFMPMQPIRPMPAIDLQPYRPTPLDAIAVPVTKTFQTFDVEAYTSLLELVRLTRRELRLGLFEIAGAQAFPFVARSEAGGYETMRSGLAAGEKVHPVRELRRLIIEQDRLSRHLDDRLAGQLAELTAQARTRLAATPVPLVVLGCCALAMVALCPFFGFTIALTRVASAPFVLAVALTGITGLAFIPLGILSMVTLFQQERLKRFGREVIESIEPMMPDRPSPIPPIESWPSERMARRRNMLILIAVSSAIASLLLLFVSLRHG